MDFDFSRYIAGGFIGIVVLLSSLWGSYCIGYGKAEAEGETAIAELKQAYSEGAVQLLKEQTKELQKVKEESQKKQNKANALEAEILDLKKNLTNERRGLSGRIAYATSSNDCTLSPESVLLYNQALYGSSWLARFEGRAKSTNSTSIPQGSAAPTPLGSGVLQEQPVTIKDLLAHAKLYGEWAREVFSIALGWNELMSEQ